METATSGTATVDKVFGSPRALAYWLTIVICGMCVSSWALIGWGPSSHELGKLCLYVLAALATSGFKVWLPGISSTVSMNYVFLIAGLSELHLGGGIVISIASVIGQSFYRFKNRPRWQHVVFNTSQLALAVSAASICIDHPALLYGDPYGLFPIVGASLAYFVVNTVVLSGIIAFSSGKPVITIWKGSFLWTSPQYLVGGLIAKCFRLLVGWIGWGGALLTLPVVYLVYRSYNVYLTKLSDQQKHTTEMADLHLRTIEALALAIDAKDDTTSAHLRRVQIYASEIGKELGLSPLEQKAIEAAALLHDIGKLAVPESIISKPGRLTPAEFEKMKIHPVIGAQILERVNFPYPVVPIVRGHHEKFDGTGYPDGLQGEEIPIGARILSVVDCLDALASDRQYRKAMPLDDAIRIVVGESGKSYDPKVVAILQARFRDLEVKARSETADAATISFKVVVERGASPATGFAVDQIQVAPDRNVTMSISDARREFQLLADIARDLGGALSLNETLALLAVRLSNAVPHDAVVIWVCDQYELIPRLVKGEGYQFFSSLRIPLGRGVSGWVAEHNQPMVNGNPAVESSHLGESTGVTSLRSALAVPLVCREQVVGVLTLYRLQTDAFNLDHRRLLVNISSKVGMVIENASRFGNVPGSSGTDPLTGLLNPASLKEYLAEAVSSCGKRNASMAVIVMDLDGFKAINDTHGNLAGNRVLQSVATSLRKCCRTTDAVARIGGDEFVLVLNDPGEYVPALMERISEMGYRAGEEIGSKISISLGNALYPQDASDTEGLLEKADERMYLEKRRRKSLQPTSSAQVIVFPKDRTKDAEPDTTISRGAMAQQA